jgi:hypothetical protein
MPHSSQKGPAMRIIQQIDRSLCRKSSPASPRQSSRSSRSRNMIFHPWVAWVGWHYSKRRFAWMLPDAQASAVVASDPHHGNMDTQPCPPTPVVPRVPRPDCPMTALVEGLCRTCVPGNSGRGGWHRQRHCVQAHESGKKKKKEKRKKRAIHPYPIACRSRE